MPDIASPYWLYDLRGRPLYLAAGDYGAVLPDVARLHSTQGWLNASWLAVQKLYPRRLVTDRALAQLWSNVTAAIAAPVTGALFWHTTKTGVAQWVGGLATDDRRFLVKAYPQAEDALLARQQSAFMHHYFQSVFTIVPVLSVRDRVVLYPLLSPGGKDVAASDIATRLRDLGMRHRDQFARTLKPARDYIHLNLPHLLQKAGQADMWQAAHDVLTRQPALPMVPVHGNVTADRVFASDRLSPVLLDYERAGWHVPFYDWWHFQMMPQIARGRLPDWRALRETLCRDTHSDAAFLTPGLFLYLLDQLSYDLQNAADHPRERAASEKSASLTICLTQAVLDDLRRTLHG